MPTYDYACEACDHRFEVFQSMSADPVRKCPECGKRKVKRLIGAGAGLIFKGSGFYITDYRSSEYKEKAAAEKKASDGASDSKGGSDSKGAGESKGGSDSKRAGESKSKDTKSSTSSSSKE